MVGAALAHCEMPDDPLPERMLAWQLYGAGLENLGRNGHPVSIPVPAPADDEILVRVDAVGLCFSDVKLIKAGPNHPRILGRDLRTNPTIPGHEVSVTVVKAGTKRARNFVPGQRYIVQADVFYRGENPAFGYAIPGGFAQYALIDKRMLEGDEGCYLLAVKRESGYSEAALIEPWACVEGAYSIADRTGTKEQGKVLLVIWAGASRSKVIHQVSALLRGSSRPSTLFLSDEDEKRAHRLRETAQASGTEVKLVARPAELLGKAELGSAEANGFDDIVLLSPPSCETVDKFIPSLSKGGILNIVSSGDLRGQIVVDVGAVHYRGVRIVGSDHGTLLKQYTTNTRMDLKPEGAAWFVGAGGPMGQMHVQRAVAREAPPRTVVATDIDHDRLQHLESRFDQRAAQIGIGLHALSPRNFSEESVFEQKISELAGSSGFDDVVLLAPVPSAMEQAAKFLAAGGILNVFAGVPIGTKVRMDIELIFKSCRIVGSSGSRVRDLRRTLELTEGGFISPNESVAAIGGMHALRDGIQAVQGGVLAGKVVIYPHILDLPLTPLNQLRKTMAAVASKLTEQGLWTREAERVLFETELAR